MAQVPHSPAQHKTSDRAAAAGRTSRTHEHAEEIERRVVVPLLDEPEPGRVIYDARITLWALAGAALGAIALGFIGWLIAAAWPIRDFGQFAASGTTVSTLTAAGVGAALGALAGALMALVRLPSYRGNHP